MKKKTSKKVQKSRAKSKTRPTKKTSISKEILSLLPKVMPLGSRVLIRPFTKEELTEKNSFGIILPTSNANEKGEQGTVLAVGPGEWKEGKLVAPAVKAGDKVAFSKYGYEDIQVNGEELYLIKEENILAVLK